MYLTALKCKCLKTASEITDDDVALDAKVMQSLTFENFIAGRSHGQFHDGVYYVIAVVL